MADRKFLRIFLYLNIIGIIFFVSEVYLKVFRNIGLIGLFAKDLVFLVFCPGIIFIKSNDIETFDLFFSLAVNLVWAVVPAFIIYKISNLRDRS